MGYQPVAQGPRGGRTGRRRSAAPPRDRVPGAVRDAAPAGGRDGDRALDRGAPGDGGDRARRGGTGRRAADPGVARAEVHGSVCGDGREQAAGDSGAAPCRHAVAGPESGHVPAASLPPQDLQSLFVEVVALVADDEGPDAMVAHVDALGPHEEQLAFIEELLRAPHPRTTDVLLAIGRLHPDKVIAKTARTIAFKRRGLRLN